MLAEAELYLEYSHFEKDDQCISNIGLSVIKLTSKMKFFVTYSHHIGAHPGLPQTSKMENFTKIVNS